MHIDEQDLSGVYRLWGEMAAFPVGDSESALTHLLGAIAVLLGGTDAFWVGATRLSTVPDGDRLSGWRARSARFRQQDELRDQVLARFRSEHKTNIADPHTEAMHAQA